MKKLLLVFFSLVFLAGIAEAGPKEVRLKRVDKNKDGVVDAKEKRMEKTEKRKVDTWWEKKADTNSDGVMSEEELAAGKKLAREKMDLNGDGVIDSKEKRMRWRHSKGKVNTKIEKQYDANGDGWLEESEVRAMLKARHELIIIEGKTKVDSAIEKEYDINKDGAIDSEEAAVMKKDADF